MENAFSVEALLVVKIIELEDNAGKHFEDIKPIIKGLKAEKNTFL